MKKIKCTSCGGEMTIDSNKEYATCNYCGTKYKLNEDVNININIDEDVKEVLNKGISHIGKIRIFIFIPIIIFVLIALISVFTFNKTSNDISENMNEDFNNIRDEYNITAFNGPFELYSGTQNSLFTKELLNEIITNNQKNKNQLINVIYNETITTDVNEIMNIQNALNNENYTILFDYDDKGYINKVTIK